MRTSSLPVLFFAGIVALFTTACGTEVAEGETTLDEDIAADSPAPVVQAGLQGCEDGCNFQRIRGEIRCDRYYDPDGQPGLNSGCIQIVFEQYESCLDGCSIAPILP